MKVVGDLNLNEVGHDAQKGTIIVEGATVAK
jgi:hypothetical protein